MSDDLQAFGVKLDMILDRLNRLDIVVLAHQNTANQQQIAMSLRVDRLKEEVDRMIGGRLNPYWVYALITIAGVVVGYLTGVKIGH